MKKMLYMAAATAVALSSCSNELEVAENNVPAILDEGAVTFNAYEARQTRGAVQNLSTVGTQGFGVFAYDQGNTTYDSYSASNTQPNFMYNQKVAKAYTTYKLNTLADLNAWAGIADADIAAQYTGTIKPTSSAEFTSAEVTILTALGGTWTSTWGGFGDSQTAPTGATLNISQYKGLSDELKAKFELDGSIIVPAAITRDAYNALVSSKHQYYTGQGDADWLYSPVKYYNNNEHAKHSFFAYAPYSPSVKAVFANSKAPQIRYTSADDYDLMWGCEWKKDGSDASTAPMNIEKPGVTDKVAFNFKHALSRVSITAVPFFDEVHGSTYPTLHPEHTAVGSLPEKTTVTLRSVKFVGASLPSRALLNLEDGTWTIEATDENAYDLPTSNSWGTPSAPARQNVMTDKMIIPITGAFKIRVVYDVTTLDTENPKNSSTIVNTITSEREYTLEKGVAYMFHLDLGLTSVKFDAKVEDWNEPKDIDVDLPNNILESVAATVWAESTAPVAEPKFIGSCPTIPEVQTGMMYLNTSDNTMYEESTGSWIPVATATKFMNNSVIYEVAAGGITTTKDAPRWIKTTDNHYWLLVNGAYVDKQAAIPTYSSDEPGFWVALNANSLSEGVYQVGSTYYYVKP